MLEILFFFPLILCWFDCENFDFWEIGNPFNQWVANSSYLNISSNTNTSVEVTESAKSNNHIPINSLHNYLQTVLGVNEKNSETIQKRIKFSQDVKTAIFAFNSSNIAIAFDDLTYFDKTPEKFYNFFIERTHFYLHIYKHTPNEPSTVLYSMRKSSTPDNSILKSDLLENSFNYKDYVSIDEIEKLNSKNGMLQNEKSQVHQMFRAQRDFQSESDNEKVSVVMKEVKGRMMLRRAFLESTFISLIDFFKQKQFFFSNFNSSCTRFGYECKFIPVYRNKTITNQYHCGWRNEVGIVSNREYRAYRWSFNNTLDNNLLDSYFNILGQEIESYLQKAS